MTLKYYVIHELIKIHNSTPDIVLSEQLADDLTLGQPLVLKLSERYRERETYGRFDPGLDAHDKTVFPYFYRKYLKEGTSDSFLEFTKQAMRILKNIVREVTAATGGYVLFADYTTRHGDFTAIYFVRDTDGYLFSKEPNGYKIKSQPHIEIEKLAMACKLLKDRIKKEVDGNHLSFIRTNRQTTSNYFIDWINASELRLNSEYTDVLCDIIKGIDELPIIDDIELTRDEFQRLVYEHCSALPNRMVNLKDLSTLFYGEEKSDKLSDYADSKGYLIDSEFVLDREKLKRLYRIRVSADNIILQFDRKSLNTAVKLEGEQVVINSKTLANKIRLETYKTESNK